MWVVEWSIVQCSLQLDMMTSHLLAGGDSPTRRPGEGDHKDKFD